MTKNAPQTYQELNSTNHGHARVTSSEWANLKYFFPEARAINEVFAYSHRDDTTRRDRPN
jgi:hypothetical protein